jgi:hypothetical protein
MSTELLRSLPGFTFETVTAPLDEALPRMDVAAFVGFAASGPVNVPVAIETAAEFADVFGADVMLAWDLARGEPASAHLGPAVRAFFRNGGRRCWVVRVARDPIANRFALPGLLAWSPNQSEVRPALAQARSEGSWSDGLEVATVVRRNGLLATGAWRNGGALDLALPSTATLQSRDLLEVAFAAQRYRAYGAVDAITVTASGTTSVHLDPVVWLADPPRVEYFGAKSPFDELPMPSRVQVLHLDLLVRRAGAEPQRLEDLGLVKGHPRFWDALLPTDTAFFTPWADPMAVASSDQRAAITRRFPLSGGVEPIDMTVPIGESVELDFRGPIAASDTALVRDGLTTFDASLFLDARLRDVGTNALPEMAASFKYHKARTPQPLDGIHALMFIEEATLIAVPDAVHRSWTPKPETDPAPGVSIPAEVAPKAPCAAGPPFEVCDPGLLAAPTLKAIVPPDTGNTIALEWNSVSAANRYAVEEADAPAFSRWYEVATIPSTSFEVYDRPPGTYAFRVRAISPSQRSLASSGQTVTIAASSRAVLTPDSYSSRGLLEVQRAMLRMCAARGDMVAVLALPESYREQDALAHVRQISSGSIETALSYGAIYHPWIIVSDEIGGAPRRMPPDGSACGVIARRNLARGAWVAPANETWRGVVALTPPLRRDARSRRELLTSQLNIITQEPEGFMTLNADTLSRELELRPLNVRRLLILLRRRALQVGARYVFEPNGPALSRLVQRGFEEMLGYLYERGAFAGLTAKTAYQVVVDDGLNTPSSRDLGRFLVELRVAPSWPLTYLRVRLLQRGDRLSATEER